MSVTDTMQKGASLCGVPELGVALFAGWAISVAIYALGKGLLSISEMLNPSTISNDETPELRCV